MSETPTLFCETCHNTFEEWEQDVTKDDDYGWGECPYCGSVWVGPELESG